MTAYDPDYNAVLKVFSQMYVVRPSVTHSGEPITDSCPLAYATPYEANAAGEKRRATGDDWARVSVNRRNASGHFAHYETHAGVAKIYDNVPREGFRVTDNVKRTYWGGGNVVFRVEDPLGFEIEIQSQNLMALISTCGILPGGYIPGKCVYGRDKSTNVIIQESSSEYQNAIHAAEKMKKTGGSASRIGKTFVCASGSIGLYVGTVYAAAKSVEYTAGAASGVTHFRSDDGQEYHGTIPTRTERIREAGKFDAVLVFTKYVPGEVNRGCLTLYKKAPFVGDAIDSVPVSDNEAFLHAALELTRGDGGCGVNFASPSVAGYGSIVSLTTRKPIRFKFVPACLSDGEFDDLLTQFTEPYYAPRLAPDGTMGLVRFFNGYRTRLLGECTPLIAHGDNFYCNPFDIDPAAVFNSWGRKSSGSDKVVTLAGYMRLYNKATEYVYDNTNLGGDCVVRPGAPINRVAVHDGIVLPRFSSIDESVAYLRSLHAKQLIHTLDIVPVFE